MSGWFQQHDDIQEALITMDFTETEAKILNLAIRKKLRFGEEKLRLAASYIHTEIHQRSSIPSIKRALSTLQKRNILIQTHRGTAYGDVSEFDLNLNVSEWNPEKVEVTKSGIKNDTSVVNDTSIIDETSITDDPRTSIIDDTGTSITNDTQELNITNNQTEHSQTEGASDNFSLLEIPEFQAAWNSYCDMRFEGKKPFTDNEKRVQLKFLHRFKVGIASQMLQQSADKRWIKIVEDLDPAYRLEADRINSLYSRSKSTRNSTASVVNFTDTDRIQMARDGNIPVQRQLEKEGIAWQ